MNNRDTAASERQSGEAQDAAHQAHAATAGNPAGSVVGHAAVGDEAEDARNVAKVLAGESGAFEALFLKYRQRVFTVAWRLLRDEDSALDVVQDAFVKAFEGLENLREGHFFPWIRRIAINLAIDRLRHLKRGVEVELDEHRVAGAETSAEDRAAVMVARSGTESPLRKAELSEFSAAFGEAIKKLSEAHRTVFMLHAAEGLSYKEIAELLHCSMGTVMSRLFYARKRLQELLAPHF